MSLRNESAFSDTKKKFYSGDLNTRYLNNGNILIRDLKIVGRALPNNNYFFKPWIEWQTFNQFSGPSLNNRLKVHFQAISHATSDLNNKY